MTTPETPLPVALPCPFCGAAASIIEDRGTGEKYDGPHFIVRCPSIVGEYVTSCLGNFTNLWDITPEDAAARWNRRPLAAEALRGREAGFVLVNIGCIECGVSSAVVGVFDSYEAAQAEADRLYDSHSWREGGQNSFDVFPLPTVRNVCADEYAALDAAMAGEKDSTDAMLADRAAADEADFRRDEDE